MSGKTFINIVNKTKTLAALGDKIIQNHVNISNICPNKLDEFNKMQYNTISDFEKLFSKLEKDWKYNKKSINKYWTGLS